jgi:hypothetical protein
MAMIARMTDEPRRGPEGSPPTSEEPPPRRSAVDDLTAGLGLVLSAARKVVQGVEPKKIEELGRKTFSRLDREKVEAMGRKAKERLDPRHIEELAEDAGRELVRVVERVAERMESILNAQGDAPHAKDAPSEPDKAAPSEPNKSGEASASEAGGAGSAERPKIRIKDE